MHVWVLAVMGACMGSCFTISGLRWSHLTAPVICAGIVTLETRCVKFFIATETRSRGKDRRVTRVCCSDAVYEDHTVYTRVCLEEQGADQATVSVEDGLDINEETDRHE